MLTPEKLIYIMIIFVSYISCFQIIKNQINLNTSATTVTINNDKNDSTQINSNPEKNITSSNFETFLNIMLKYTSDNNKPKQIVTVIINDISKRFDKIIPSIKDSTNLKSINKLELFQDDLSELKKSFSLEKIQKLKKSLEDFIKDNQEYLNYHDTDEKIIMEKLNYFGDFITSIITDMSKLKVEDLNGTAMIDSSQKRPEYISNMPTECTPECKCCRENLCLDISICENNKTIFNEEKAQSAKIIEIFTSSEFLILMAFIVVIFFIYLFCKKIFRFNNYVSIDNSNSGYGVRQIVNQNDISRTNIELSY